MSAEKFYPGDVIARCDGHPLRSGCEAYGSAIVIQSNPLIAVSEQTDMRWETTLRPAEMKVVGKAWPEGVMR